MYGVMRSVATAALSIAWAAYAAAVVSRVAGGQSMMRGDLRTSAARADIGTAPVGRLHHRHDIVGARAGPCRR